jgi:hypothetical protein
MRLSLLAAPVGLALVVSGCAVGARNVTGIAEKGTSAIVAVYRNGDTVKTQPNADLSFDFQVAPDKDFQLFTIRSGVLQTVKFAGKRGGLATFSQIPASPNDVKLGALSTCTEIGCTNTPPVSPSTGTTGGTTNTGSTGTGGTGSASPPGDTCTPGNNPLEGVDSDGDGVNDLDDDDDDGDGVKDDNDTDRDGDGEPDADPQDGSAGGTASGGAGTGSTGCTNEDADGDNGAACNNDGNSP